MMVTRARLGEWSVGGRAWFDGPGLAMAASVALGVGAVGGAFATGSWLVWGAVPGVHEPERIAMVWFGEYGEEGGFRPARVTYAERAQLAAGMEGLENLVGYQLGTVAVGRGSREGLARAVTAAFVTQDYFGALGVTPQLGRFFSAMEDEEGTTALVGVLSAEIADGLFPGGNPIGKVIRVNEVATVVVGVAPRGFRGVERFGDVEVWLPGRSLYALSRRAASERGHGGFYQWFGRLREGVSFQQVEAELVVAGRQLVGVGEGVGRFAQGARPWVFPGAGIFALAREDVREALRAVWLVSGLVLTVACANVGNLTLAGLARRRREWAIRRALGGTGWKLVRRHLGQTAVVALVGAAAGLWMAWGATRFFRYAMVPGLDRELGGVAIDWTVVGFVGGLALVMVLLCGVGGGVMMFREEVYRVLVSSISGERRGRHNAQRVLCMVQVASTVVLLVCGSLLVRTLRELDAVDLGFDAEQVSRFVPVASGLGRRPERVAGYVESLVDGLSAAPAVEAVAVTSATPFGGDGFVTGVRRTGVGTEGSRALWVGVSSGFFGVVGMRIEAGRDFEGRGGMMNEGGDEVVLSHSLAGKLFADGDAVGGRVAFDWVGRRGREYRVVGVVSDTRWEDLTGPPSDVVYELLNRESAVNAAAVLVRSRLGGDALRRTVERFATGIDPTVPIIAAGSLSGDVQQRLVERRTLANLLTGLAVVALALFVVGLYGILSRWVSGQMREIGVRLALGATRSMVYRLVTAQAAGVVASGLTVGYVGAALAAGVMAHYLHGVEETVWVSYVVAGGIIGLGAGTAVTAPALRAVRLDPAAVLRDSWT